MNLYSQSKIQLERDIDSYMQTVAMKDGFTGTIVITHHGQPVIKKGYGLANRQTLLPNKPETLHNLGSGGATAWRKQYVNLIKHKSPDNNQNFYLWRLPESNR